MLPNGPNHLPALAVGRPALTLEPCNRPSHSCLLSGALQVQRFRLVAYTATLVLRLGLGLGLGLGLNDILFPRELILNFGQRSPRGCIIGKSSFHRSHRLPRTLARLGLGFKLGSGLGFKNWG